MAKNQIVAIDIGTNTIKIVQLEQVGRGSGAESEIRLISAAVERYPRTSPTEEITAQTISQTLQRVWTHVQGRKPTVALSIPRAQVASRRLTNLPTAASDEQLADLVALQAETELPFREDVVHDYYDVTQTNNGVSVELIGTRRETVQKYLDYLKPIGVIPKSILPTALATGVLAGVQPGNRGLETAPTAIVETTSTASLEAISTSIIVDIGAGQTDFVLLRGGVLKFSRSFSVGGNQLTRRYQNDEATDFESAERRKIENATLAADHPAAMPAHEWANRLVLELERSIAAAERELGINRSEWGAEIWLCGGGARIPGLADYCADRLNTVQLWNPYDAFNNIWNQETPPQSIAEFGDTLAVALGLGINAITDQIPLDLLPREEKAKLTQVEQRRRFITAAAAGVVLLIGLGLGGFTWSQVYQGKVNVLEAELGQIRRAESNAQKTLVKNTAVVNLLAPRISTLDILRELSLRFADRTKVAWKTLNITRLDESDKAKITFNVDAKSHDDISAMIRVMAQSGLFTNVASGEVKSVQGQRGKPASFQAQVTFNLAADGAQKFAQIRHLPPDEVTSDESDGDEGKEAESVERPDSEDSSDGDGAESPEDGEEKDDADEEEGKE
jgi:type IV pilus assembly protein PilM